MASRRELLETRGKQSGLSSGSIKIKEWQGSEGCSKRSGTMAVGSVGDVGTAGTL